MKPDSILDSKCKRELDISIGCSAQDNWDIIDAAGQHDYWFHLQDNPSCHVILHVPSKKTEIDKQTLIHCAMLCKQNSKYANQKNVKIIYTQRRNISKGDAIGSVHTKKALTIIC
jgi:predicted ribosome quality control (RQC) complex YloA/Tae2 family protein